MGRHTLELKLGDVSSAGELRASTTPRSCRLLDVQKRSYERGAALYTRLQLVERDYENTLADNTAGRIGTLGEILRQISDTGIRGSRCRSRARGWREVLSYSEIKAREVGTPTTLISEALIIDLI